MRIERLEKRAAEQELIARLTSDERLSLKNQKRAELLRSRIEELNRRLAASDGAHGRPQGKVGKAPA